MNLPISYAVAAILVTILVGYLMIRRAPNAKWMIIVLMFLIIGSAGFMLFMKNGGALLSNPLPEQRIAFVSDTGGHADIWTMRLDGTGRQNLTNDSADDRTPAWTPDGSELAYVTDRANGKYQIGVSSWDGRNNRIITTNDGTKDAPNISPDGKKILFINSGKVYIVDRVAGEEEQVLPPHEGEKSSIESGGTPTYARADYSFDSSYLLCLRDTDTGRIAYAMETPNGEITESPDTKVLGEVSAKEMDAAWSPKGSVFAIACVDSAGANILGTLDLGSMERKELFKSKGDTTGPLKLAWSPDGTKIAYELWAVKDGATDKCLGVYCVDVSGGKPVLVLAGDVHEPNWSADSKHLICTKARSDNKRDLWCVDPDGKNAVNLTKGKGDNFNPACSPMPKLKS